LLPELGLIADVPELILLGIVLGLAMFFAFLFPLTQADRYSLLDISKFFFRYLIAQTTIHNPFFTFVFLFAG